MTGKLPLSVLIPARNEAGNIRACIESASLAADIVVVDSNSTDETPHIARAMGARVVNFDWNGHLPKKKNWALEHIDWPYEWVFILDADERWTTELAAELAQIVTHTSAYNGYYVNRRFWFLDGWLKHCGYFPSWNLRLLKPCAGRYEQLPEVGETQSGDNEVHEHIILQGSAGYLQGLMDHYAFPDISTWVEKHNRYSSWEAKVENSVAAQAASASADITPAIARKRRLRRWARQLPFRPFIRFCYHYIVKAGFLDGYRGWVFCRLLGYYEFLGVTKATEARRQSSSRS